MARPTTRVKKILKKLSNDPANRIIIVSGRPKSTLSKFFDDIGLGLIAEHGGWIFDAGKWVKSTVASKKWKKAILPILDQYASRTPGAEVEEKDFSLVWHYRRVSPDMAFVRKEELKKSLHNILESDEIGIFEGQKILEVKPKRMHKGALVTEILSGRDTPDFILAIGDDYTDEDMFEALPERAYTINVGAGETIARYQLNNVSSVLHLLENLKN
jgi:trehalose 6-phosphate synthase/phosphatase